MAEHRVPRTQATAGFSAGHDPVLRVRAGAGDLITVETDDEAYAQMETTGDLAAVTATINPVTGPVFVEGAEPGDALAVTIHHITPGPQGWSVYLPGAGALAAPMGEDVLVRRIPVAGARAHLAAGLSVPVAPMIGCIGVAPARGEASTVMPSYPTGGNMDLTDVRAGSTVLLPVQVEGALLSIGDLHAVMSRGESSFVAIEVAGTATVSVDVVKGARLRSPRVDTGREVVCVGLGDPVQAAITAAYEDLFSHLVDERGWDRGDAYVAMSAAAHTELGGPTGSGVPDPLHPLTPVGAVALARMAHEVIAALATRAPSQRTARAGSRISVSPGRATSAMRSASSYHRRTSACRAPATSTSSLRPVASSTARPGSASAPSPRVAATAETAPGGRCGAAAGPG